MEVGLSVSSTSLYRGLKCYWKGRMMRMRGGYERLNGSGRRRKNRVEYKKSGFWKINLKPRLKLSLNMKVSRFSPKKLLMNMRDGYVNMMMKIANSKFMSPTVGIEYGMRQLKEYDEKVLVEIYKSMIIAHGQVVHRHGSGGDANASDVKFGTQVMCQN